jgi:hypothetical protein
MLKKVLIALVLLIAVFAVVVALQPSAYTLTRSATIAAAPADVFPHINEFKNWAAWSPWEKLDPDMKRTFEGPAAGKGSVYKWTGNDKVGEGMMTIVQSEPAKEVRIKLDFIKPFESTADTLFGFAPAGSGTTVTWTMKGRNDNFIAKAFCLVTGGPEKMVGPDFEKGLAQMKAVVEKGDQAKGKS